MYGPLHDGATRTMAYVTKRYPAFAFVFAFTFTKLNKMAPFLLSTYNFSS